MFVRALKMIGTVKMLLAYFLKGAFPLSGCLHCIMVKTLALN